MSFLKTDIGFFLSGGTSNVNANNSLGSNISNTAIVSASKNNVFPDTTATEAAGGITRYRCIYIKNINASKTMTFCKVWILQNSVSLDDDIEIAVGGAAKNLVEPSISPETVAPPSPVVFTKPTSEVVSLALPNLAPNEHIALWIKLISTINADPLQGNSAMVRVKCTPI
jgi:hypothetical protein